MVADRSPAMGDLVNAQSSVDLAPRATHPATSLGNARDGAPSWSHITIDINSTVVYWNWVLVMLMGTAAVLGGRRCFFSDLSILALFVVVMLMLVMNPLRS